jgi:nucleotide-binding universal stress UspA family protein
VNVPASCVVVGVDGSAEARAALRWAFAVAGGLGARLVVVHALGLLEGAGLRPTVDPAEVAGEVAGELAADGGSPKSVTTLIEPGTPPDVLVRVAAREGGDLVVVGSRGLGGTRLALGSTSEAVLSRSPVPVVVLPASLR